MPVASGKDEDTYTHNVNAVVHSMIADTEEGDDGHDGDDDDDVDCHGDDTEVLFMRSTDLVEMASSSQLMSGVVADHEDEMLADVNSNRAFRGNKRGKTCLRWNIGNSCSVGCVPIIFIFGFLIMLGSVMISYANNVARTHGLHHDGPIVQGLHQAVPASPPDLNLVCSDHFYDELGNGLEACKTACAPGTCCNVDKTSNNKNCFAYNTEFCETYSVCLILKETCHTRKDKTLA
jgi:hypothetical protein